MSSPTARRRQRSTRLTVAGALLTSGAVIVIAAFLGDVAWFQALAAVSAVVLGAAATRITHSELVKSRLDHARDRAEQARAYRSLTEQRTAEHTAFAAGMQVRVNQQETALVELELALGNAQKRAAEATRKFNAEAKRADLAEQEVIVLRADLDAWQRQPERLRA